MIRLTGLFRPCFALLALLSLLPASLRADATYFPLSSGNFSQDWSNAGLITTNDDWSGVPGIIGYLGQDITTGTGVDPQTLTGTSAVANDVDVIANQTNTGITNGGVAEFQIANPVVALQGSGTADAPYLLLHLNTTGRTAVTVSYNLRDIDGTTDNAVQPVTLQYRVGSSGAFTNLPAGFVADATTGPSLATAVAAVSVVLPAAAENQPQVQVRIMTTNAAGNDEWVGIDDILVTSTGGGGAIAPIVTTSPTSQTVTAGAIVQFTGAASGTPPVGYQWRKNTVPLSNVPGVISGATSPMLTLTGVTTADSGSYDFIASNAGGDATSLSATLVVNAAGVPPSITTPPTEQTVQQGGPASFSVGVSGTAPFAYQWRRNGSPLSDVPSVISGTNGPILSINAVTSADAGSYDVVVSNGFSPDAFSTPVALIVTPPAPIPSSVGWNFGTSAESATPSLVSADLTGGAIDRGNNNGTTPILSTTSASSGYTGSTGQFNAGAAARTGVLNKANDGSAYFEFAVTPADTKEFTPTTLTFGSRSTGTGPTTYAIFTSLDGYTTPVASGPFAAVGTTSWGLNTVALSGLTTGAGLDLSFRIYGYGGAGNPAAGTANWRIDDLKVTGTTAIGVPVPPAVVAVTPGNGAAGVIPNAAITVTFNRNVVAGASAFAVTGSASGAHVMTVSGGPKIFTLTPTTPYALGETVALNVSAAGITNTAGTLHPASDFASTFTTLSPIPVAIHTIQGSGLTSPSAGQALVVEGIVVASFQGANGVGGYYIEAPQAEWDADPATSEGILVFDNANLVAVGDHVKVSGSVVEFGTAPATETEISPVYTFAKISSGNPLPPTLAVTLPFPAAGYAERYEGMLVTLPQTLTVTDTFDLGHFGEIMLSNGRLSTPTNIVAPGAPAQAQLAANLLNQVMLDDGISPPYPDPTPYLSSSNPATATRRSGSTTAGVTGAFGHKFGSYVIEPTASVTFVDANPRTTTPPAQGPGLRVAIGNVLNFFNGDGAGGGFPTSRGATTFAEYQAQRAKMIAGILAIAPDIMGLTEVENDRVTNSLPNSYGPTSAIADIVNGLNAGAPVGTTYAFVDASAVDIVSDVIHCAFIYRVETVAPVGAPAMLNDPSFTGVSIGIARNPLAQTFREIASGEKFTASINHFKSKGSASSDPGAGSAALNADSGDGQGASNHVRKLQAQALVSWLATDPTGSGDPDFLIIGDLNAYAKEDPISIIEGAGYINLTEVAEGPGGYSYAFDASFGHLDHALANGPLASQVADAGTFHVNSDEPVYLDYNAEDKSAAQQAVNAGTPFRYSDHDPVVVRLQLGLAPAAPAITTAPTSKTTTTGTSVTFSVAASGVPAPTYQWRHNGVDIEGATSATYTIASPTSADAGSYVVFITNSVDSITSDPVTLTVNPALAGVQLSDLEQVYDGSPKPVSATTTPLGLPVTIKYNGSTTPPTLPGWYTVVATINSPDYTGTASGQLFVDVTALVKSMPVLDGKIQGSVQIVSFGSVTLNGAARITGDLLMYGTIFPRVSGNASYSGLLSGPGTMTVAWGLVTLNGNATMGHVVQRVNGQVLPVIAAPPAPTGTRDVTLTEAGQSAGDFATLRNLTANGAAGKVVVPAGTYGAFSVGGNASLVLGTAGATTPAVYNLSALTLTGASSLEIAGPVILNVATGVSIAGSVGAPGQSEWLSLNIASGGLTLLNNVTFWGSVTAPSATGTVTIGTGSILTGRVIANRLVINAAGELADPEFQPHPQAE